MHQIFILELLLPHSYSLKDKRQILRSIKDKTHRINVSIAETGQQDIYNYAQITLAIAASSSAMMMKIRETLYKIISETDGVEIIRENIIE